VVIRRGQIWWVDLGTPRGSSPGYKRPVAIIQTDTFNETEIGTIVVAVVTSNIKLAEMPGNVFVTARNSGLDRDSVVNVSQIFTIDKSDVLDQIGHLGKRDMKEIDDGLRLVLAL
jgi:mRNA interferase MazF